MPEIDIERLKTALVRDEGFRGHAYQCSEGYWTIGIGRLIDEDQGGSISEGEARMLLENDLQKFFRELDRNLDWWRELPAAAQEGLVNMCFNLGYTKLSKFSDMLAALQAGEYEVAAAEALDSRWAEQVGARSERIAEMFRSCEIEGAAV